MLGNYSFSQDNSFQKSMVDMNDMESSSNDLFHKTSLQKCFSLISDMIKAAESEFNENFPKKLKNSFIITSIFSLLNFELTIIQQLTDLINQTKNNNIECKKLVKNLLNFSKELIFHKIQQIFSDTQNNYNNPISNRNDIRKGLKTQKISKKLVSNSNKQNKNKIREKILKHQRGRTDSIHENKTNINNLLYKKPIYVKNKNNINRYSMYTPPKNFPSKNNIKLNNTLNNSSINDIFKLTENNSNKNRNIVKSALRNYNKSKSCINSEKRENKTIIVNRLQNKSTCIENEENEINPIRKIKNIIIKAKFRSSLSMDGNSKSIMSQKEENETLNQEKKFSPTFNKDIDYYNKFENKNIMRELMENNKKLSNHNTIIERIEIKERETNEIFNDCMNNVKKRLDNDEKNKTKKLLSHIKNFKNAYNSNNYKNIYNKNNKNTNIKNK